MKTTVIRIDPRAIDAAAIGAAANVLRAGGLVAFPTETVYGLGVHALDAAAVKRLFEAKGRPSNDPLIVHVTELDAVREVARDVPAAALALAGRFWPGPLTMVLPRGARVPLEVTAGLDTVGIRIPAHPVARALIEAAGIPVAAPSANLFSRPSPTQASHVLQDLDGRIDMLLDGGATDVGIESTVVDLTSPHPRILRPGIITAAMIDDALAGVATSAAATGDDGDDRRAKPAPGMLSKHYAPRAPLTVFTGPEAAAIDAMVDAARQAALRGERVGVLAVREDVQYFGDFAVRLAELGSRTDLPGVAARLYGALRELDAAGVEVIFARALDWERHSIGAAIRDRLRRATATEVSVD